MKFWGRMSCSVAPLCSASRRLPVPPPFKVDRRKSCLHAARQHHHSTPTDVANHRLSYTTRHEPPPPTTTPPPPPPPPPPPQSTTPAADPAPRPRSSLATTSTAADGLARGAPLPLPARLPLEPPGHYQHSSKPSQLPRPTSHPPALVACWLHGLGSCLTDPGEESDVSGGSGSM